MKIYIVADMEGICGVVDSEQINGNKAWDVDRVRRQFTEEVCAVCQGALEGGAEEIYINDFHGNGRNILQEKLPMATFLIQGGFRPTSGFDFFDNTFNGLMLLGAHARTGSRESVLPHTYSPHIHFELFGQPVGEFDILSLLAGENKVPTLLISGDSKTIEQARTNLPATHCVVTKFSIGPGAALCFHPANILESLKDEAGRAVKGASNIEPPAIVPPIQLTARTLRIELAERLDWIPQLNRKDENTFEFIGENMKQVAKLIYGISKIAALP